MEPAKEKQIWEGICRTQHFKNPGSKVLKKFQKNALGNEIFINS